MLVLMLLFLVLLLLLVFVLMCGFVWCRLVFICVLFLDVGGCGVSDLYFLVVCDMFDEFVFLCVVIDILMVWLVEVFEVECSFFVNVVYELCMFIVVVYVQM